MLYKINMSSLIFEFKKNKYKNIFGIINSPKQNNPIKSLLDSPNKYHSLHSKLHETLKLPKISQINKNKKNIINNTKSIEKQDEYDNIKYNSKKKINKVYSRNDLKALNYDEDTVAYFWKYTDNTKNNKYIKNNHFNKCHPSKYSNNNRKYKGANQLSPLVYNSIDIIKNNPYNKKLFMKIGKKKKGEIKNIINNNYEEDTCDIYNIKKDVEISPIPFKIKSLNDNKNEEELNKRTRKLSYDNPKPSNKKNIFRIKKDVINELYSDTHDNKNLKNNKIENTFKELKKNKHTQIDLEQNKKKENKNLGKLLFNYKNNNKSFNEIKKIVFRNIPSKLNNYYLSQNKNDEEEFYFSKYKNTNYENEEIEFESNDDSKEYYINKCNLILEYAYKEDRNYSHKMNMEDKGKSILNFNNDPNKLLFCLFDGHGGHEVSSYLQKYFPIIMKKYIYEAEDEEINFEKLFEEIDEELKKRKYFQIGSTASIIYITKIKNETKILYCINIGDTKCILAHTKGSRKLSYDDLVSDENERYRIINEGGYIKNGRIHGRLMVSRAFGDWEFKSYGVICTPHVTKIDINDNYKYVIMASDGIWDVLDDLDVYKMTLTAENSQKLCDKIIQEAIEKDSTDNLSCFVIKLND